MVSAYLYLLFNVPPPYMENLQPAAVTGPVTDSERAYALDALKMTQTNLHQSLADLSATQLGFKPAADRWSIAECAEHIALVETGLLRVAQAGMSAPEEASKRSQIKLSDVDLIKAARSRSFTMNAPDVVVPTGRFGGTDASLVAFDQQRKAAIDFLQNEPADLRTHYFNHFALGLLDIYQVILLMASHVERHRKQIEEVKASPGFPY